MIFVNLKESTVVNQTNEKSEETSKEDIGGWLNKDKDVFVVDHDQAELKPTPEPEPQKKDEALTTFSNHFSGIINGLANSEEPPNQKLLYLSNVVTHLKPIELIYKDTPKDVFKSYFAEFNKEVEKLSKTCQKDFSKDFDKNLESIKKDLNEEAYASLKNRISLYSKTTSELEQLKNLPNDLVSADFKEKVEKYHQKVENIFSRKEKSTKDKTKEAKEQTNNYIKELKESIKLNLEDTSSSKTEKYSTLIETLRELEYLKNKTKNKAYKDIDKDMSQINIALRTLEKDITKEFHESSKQNIRAKLLAFDMINDEVSPLNNLQKVQNKFYSKDFKKEIERLQDNVFKSFSWVNNLNNLDEEKNMNPDKVNPSPENDEDKKYEEQTTPDTKEDEQTDLDTKEDTKQDEKEDEKRNKKNEIKPVELEEECNNLLSSKAKLSMIKYGGNNQKEHQEITLDTPNLNFKKENIILKGKAGQEFIKRIESGEAKYKILNELKRKYPEDLFIVKNTKSKELKNFLAKIEADKIKALISKKIEKEMQKIQELKEDSNLENKEIIQYKEIKLEKLGALEKKVTSIQTYNDLLDTSKEYTLLRKSLREEKLSDWKNKKLDTNPEIDKRFQNWKDKRKADFTLNIN